jgi:2,4-dienoyl-CoA reductase-like NADH-dependent reductase (Old Yellow Enzyme family)/NADPH-dependent 2,4-dienoyl-CoA reductase/sulfur reductase-like enzyme
MGSIKLTKLFEPGKIGTMRIKNRIVMSPMITDYADEEGYVTQKLIDYLAERAKGGVGLIILEASYVQRFLGRAFLNQVAVYDDKYIPGLSRLTEAIKKNGAFAAIQLHHAGSAAHARLTGGLQPVGPSAVSYPGFETSRALTLDEIKEIRDCYVEAALRCQRAGFDAVQIHSCHQYLLANFLSPVWNKRTDQYGGDIGNRARFLMEVLKGVKATVTIPVICRINAIEYGTKEFLDVEHGTTLEDAKATAKLVQANGADAIHLSAWQYGPYMRYGHQPLHPGERLALVEAIRKEVSIPVIGFGRLLPEIAETILSEGKADFIGMGRGLLADPYLPQKAARGDLSDIVPCVGCYHCGPISHWGYKSELTCTVNPRCGHEGEYPYPLTQAQRSRKVLVIGGGPGGMEAARVAALRGHRVTLYEKDQRLGGQLSVADKGPLKQYISDLGVYQKGQLEKMDVTVKLGKEADKELILAQRADVVILATGSEPLIPNVKGIEKAKVVTAHDALSGKTEVGERVIVIGGNLAGCEVAGYLANKRKKVTICEVLTELLPQIIPQRRPAVIAGLTERGVVFHLGVTSQEVTDKGMMIVDQDGRQVFLEADTIVLAVGARSNDVLMHELKDKVKEIHSIGDAKEPRLIVDAVHEGFRTAYGL